MKKIFLSLLIIFNSINSYIFHEYFLNQFQFEKVPTELTTYNLLKKLNNKNNINFLVMPWSVLINENKLNNLPTIKLNGGFTICQHIYFEQIIPTLLKIGIDTLFTPHATHKKYPIKVIPFPCLPINGVQPAMHKDIFYSFIGFDTHSTRRIIFKMQHPKNSLIKERFVWHFCNEPKTEARDKKEYQDVLSKSRYSLCPRGTGPGTIRFWESLQAGAIPVLISDDILLPDNFDWEKTIIKIPENKVLEIPNILSKITQEQEETMRQNCLKAYSQFCEKNNFIKIINDYYEN